ncbi:MAG: cupin domain-containing protein [Microthrixaceae bacterium]|nr:cupin domain-containing protein [Microthrixaceae bacterium]
MTAVPKLRLTPRSRDRDEMTLVAAAACGTRRAADRLAQRLGGFRLDGLTQVVDDARALVFEVDQAFLLELDAARGIDEVMMAMEPVRPRVGFADGTKRTEVPQLSRMVDQRQGYGNPWRRLHPVGTAEALSEGVTVVLNDISPILRGGVLDLGHDVSRVRSVRTQINAYISEREAPGFGRHWDDHDVLIIQVAGRKRWEIFAPAALSPARSWVAPEACGASVLSVVLEPGLGLFIPRGWPHAVRGFADVVSVHLTVGTRRQILAETISDVEVRPAVGTPNGRFITGAVDWATPDRDAVEASVARFRGMIETLPYDGPLTTMGRLAQLGSDSLVSAALPGGAVFAEPPDPDSLSFATSGYVYEIPRPLVPSLALLLEGRTESIRILAERSPGTLPADVEQLVRTLARRDVVRIFDTA